MKHPLTRFSAALVLSAMAVLGALNQSVMAAGGGNWTDISDTIAMRQNRPVWAIARAEPYWFLTDGQDLYAGGHFWKTEGSINSDITLDVRNAGISRVDDIVSDGQTVWFLKNVTARNNSLEVVAYNGGYTNLTNQLHQYLQINEGVVSITGRNGSWAIVTTLGRVAIYTPSSNTFIVFVQQSGSAFLNDMAYSVRHASPADTLSYFPMVAQPVSNGWLIAYREIGTDTTRWFLYTSSGIATEISTQFPSIRYIQAIASNGSNVLVAGSNLIGGSTNKVYIYNGVSSRAVSNYYSSFGLSNWNRSIIASSGNTWMLMSNKRHYFINDITLYDSDTERDYFITLAGSKNGMFLAGGAVSNDLVGYSPSYPLTLKLVKVDVGSGIWNTNNPSNTNVNSNTSYSSGGHTFTSSNGPTITTSGNPSSFQVNNGDTFNYHVDATDPNGVDHIDLYVNNTLIKTCVASSCDFSSQYFTNGLSTRAVPLQARATDRQNNATAGGNETLTVGQSGSTSYTSSNTANTQTVNGTSFWSWFDPSQTWISRGQTMAFNVGAWNATGLNQIQIYVNGTVRQTCSLGRAYGNQTCSATIYGSDYSVGTSLGVNAKITNSNGQDVWSPTRYLNVTDVNSNTSYNTNVGDVSAWTTLSPTGSTLNRNSSVTLRVQANATRGLSTIDVYVNALLRRECTFSQAYGTQSCDLTINGSDYTSVPQLTLNAKATDVTGQTGWSDSKVLTVQDNTNSNTSNGTNSSWIWSSPDVTTVNASDVVNFNVGAYDQTGIRMIEILGNGAVVKTCNFGLVYGNQACAYQVATTYTGTTYANISARITNGNYTTFLSQTKSYTIYNSAGSSNTTNGNGSTWTWSSPDTTTLQNSQPVTYYVGANDTDGINRIDMYVNGSLMNSCNLGNVYGNQQCSVTINGSLYASGATVNVNAKVTDALNNTMWSQTRSYTVTTSGSGTTNSGGISSWVSSNPDTTTLQNNQSVAFTVGAWDAQGIRRMEIYVNGSMINACDLGYAAMGNQSCSVTLNGSSYSNGTNVSVNAKITDGSGNVGWSQSRVYAVSYNGASNPVGSSNTWTWSDPNVTTMKTTESVKYWTGAWDASGIRRIDMIVNGAIVNSCDLGYSASGNQQCSAMINGSDYSANTSVSASAKVTNGNGNVTWTNTTVYTVKAAATTPTFPTNLPGSITITSSRDSGFKNNETISYAVNANDQDGIQKVEILVNGVLVKTCVNAMTCGYTGGPYNDYNSVSYGAKLTDNHNNALWTGYKTIYKVQ